MKVGHQSARTRHASGRFLWLALWLGGCQVAGVDTVSPAGAPPDPVVVVSGPITDAQQREAAELLDRAEASFEANRFLESLRLTNELLERFATSDASGAALLLSARAESGAGSAERADALAERYLELLAAGDPRAGGVRLLQHDFLRGQPLIQIDRLLRIGPAAPPDVAGTALTLVRSSLDSLTVAELEIVAEAAAPDAVAAPPVYAILSAELLARAEDARAVEYATAALEAGASGIDRSIAEGVLRGELPDGLRPARVFDIATVLPFGGPPALAEYATSIAEGVEVAVSTVLGDEFTVSVVTRDDEGDPDLAAAIVSDLETEGVVGAVGFLLEETLTAAGSARTAGLPLVSPTARTGAEAGSGTYSLSGADPRSAQLVAFHAISRAFQRVAMIHPNTAEASQEADAFAAVAESFGIPIVGRFPYPAGATDYEAEFRLAQAALRNAEIAELGLTGADTLRFEMLQPVGLFMPIPAEDVEFVAPQFAYNGLDTLAIEIVGTSGWTDPQALERVDTRLLEGVVATAPVGADVESPGYQRFRLAYETHFRRSLIGDTPAIGYDAALLLLEALRAGRTRGEDVQAAIEGLEDVEGAMGVYSFVDGRLVRRMEVVRIEGGRLVPVPIG
jgi:ABC-type branched-subunit amino acid transport system substrate-binding protein